MPQLSSAFNALVPAGVVDRLIVSGERAIATNTRTKVMKSNHSQVFAKLLLNPNIATPQYPLSVSLNLLDAIKTDFGTIWKFKFACIQKLYPGMGSWALWQGPPANQSPMPQMLPVVQPWPNGPWHSSPAHLQIADLPRQPVCLLTEHPAETGDQRGAVEPPFHWGSCQFSTLELRLPCRWYLLYVVWMLMWPAPIEHAAPFLANCVVVALCVIPWGKAANPPNDTSISCLYSQWGSWLMPKEHNSRVCKAFT